MPAVSTDISCWHSNVSSSKACHPHWRPTDPGAVTTIPQHHAHDAHHARAWLRRELREPSPWRERPISESLKLFEDMRRGLVDEGAATLRQGTPPRLLAAARRPLTSTPSGCSWQSSSWCISCNSTAVSASSKCCYRAAMQCAERQALLGAAGTLLSAELEPCMCVRKASFLWHAAIVTALRWPQDEDGLPQ